MFVFIHDKISARTWQWSACQGTADLRRVGRQLRCPADVEAVGALDSDPWCVSQQKLTTWHGVGEAYRFSVYDAVILFIIRNL